MNPKLELSKIFPQKRALSTDPENTDWDIRTVEWNDALDASLTALSKRVAGVEEIADIVTSVIGDYALGLLKKAEGGQFQKNIAQALAKEFIVLKRDEK